MIEARARIERERTLSAALEDAWAVLTDVAKWGPLFPHVDSVVPYPEAGESAFIWTMEPLGPPGARVRTVYACRYHADPASHTLTWTPVEDVGTGRFAGHCILEDAGDETRGTLLMDAMLEIPAPRFMRGVVAPLVQVEMGRMTDTFMDRLDDVMSL
ncbi:SRPBCC family protein [Rubrivirga sp.]|uniref:SRPBCC family protein n=1 Tax=Rubrivirga sp. TaxID=1885344 RepID=UPI003C70B7E6